jgi:hypothetical protein
LRRKASLAASARSGRPAEEANGRADAALADPTLAQLADACERIEQAEHRADAARQRADRAESAIAGERQRAGSLRERLAEAQAMASEAGIRADAAHAPRQHRTGGDCTQRSPEGERALTPCPGRVAEGVSVFSPLGHVSAMPGRR